MSLHHQRLGAGEPLLLVHGIGSELCVWEPVLGPLSERFDVIAVDLPGFGRSPALPASIEPTPVALARALADLLDELDVHRAHVAGNSLGGWIALELAAADRARSVTAVCPAGLWGAPFLPPGQTVRGRAHRWVRRLRPVVPLAMLNPSVRRAALSPFVAHPERVPHGAATRMVRSYGRATAYDATATAMKQNFFHAADRVRVPLTIAFGERDRLIRPSRVRVPGSRTVLLPDCGHIPMWDDPELVTSVIAATADRVLVAA